MRTAASAIRHAATDQQRLSRNERIRLAQSPLAGDFNACFFFLGKDGIPKVHVSDHCKARRRVVLVVTCCTNVPAREPLAILRRIRYRYWAPEWALPVRGARQGKVRSPRRIFRSISARVCPTLMQPGRSGT